MIMASWPPKASTEFDMQLNAAEKVDDSALNVLKQGHVQGMAYHLPAIQLKRNEYLAVNDVLERLGGKWNKKAKSHLFEEDPSPLLERLIQTGLMPLKNPTAYFPTPAHLAERMAGLIPASAHTVLEPSAGTGHIARAIRAARSDVQLDCCEVYPRFQEKLKEQGFNVVAEDFLSYCPEQLKHDVILMNPPFSLEEDRLAYVPHIMHAWSLLAPDGLLVAIAPNGVMFRNDKRLKALNSLIEAHGTCEELEEDTFKESGTGVRTVLITLHKKDLAIVNPSSNRTEDRSIATSDLGLRSKVLTLTEELNQLEQESHKLTKQINQNIKMLFPAEEKPSQMTLW